MSGSGPAPEAGSRTAPGCVTIRCRQDGPLVVELPAGTRLRVIDHQGAEFSLPEGKPLVALCRCGASRTKPFCDGSHRSSGFLADAPAPSHA